MTRGDLERVLAELRVPAGELDAALTELRRERWVEREPFTRSYVRARLQGADHAAALALSIGQAREVGTDPPTSSEGRRRIPVVVLPPDPEVEEPEVETRPRTASTTEPSSGPIPPTRSSPARSWVRALVAFGLLAILSVVGFIVVTSPSSPLEGPPPPADVVRAPTVDAVHPMAVVGRAGSGKSVFLASLFSHLHVEVNVNPATQWTVNVVSTEAQAFIDETSDLLRRSEWPTRSAGVIVATGHERSSGRELQLQISEAAGDALEPHGEKASLAGAEGGLGALEARSVMLLVDGGRLDAPETWDLDAFLDTCETARGSADRPRAAWLAIVITKSDAVDAFVADPEQIAKAHLGGVTFTRLKHCFRWVRVFAVSAVGKTLVGPDGQRVPDPYAVPVGVHEPLIWILDGVRTHEAERLARDIDRQHGADDAATERLWAEHEAVRRGRVQRRLLGLILFLAAGLAALSVVWALAR